jgi:hypothetical protein
MQEMLMQSSTKYGYHEGGFSFWLREAVITGFFVIM